MFEPEDLNSVNHFFINKNPNRSEDDNDIKWPLSIIDYVYSNFIHFDLYYAIRRTYGTLLENFKLTSVEDMILDFQRKDDLPSAEIPDIYRSWMKDKSQYMGGMLKIIEHNYYDVVNMGLLLKEWIITYIEDMIELIKNDKSEFENKSIKKDADNDKISKISDFLKAFSKKNKRKPKTIDMYLIPRTS